jgi:hypothetical protein
MSEIQAFPCLNYFCCMVFILFNISLTFSVANEIALFKCDENKNNDNGNAVL